MVELIVGRPVMRVVAAETTNRERGREEKLQKQEREVGFFSTLDPSFSSLRP
jgi:hypothetical protein